MNLSPEKELLLSCAATQIADERLCRINELFLFPIKWEKIVAFALWYDVAPLVYHSLKRISRSNPVPEGVLETLGKSYHMIVARNMYLYAELYKILQEFKERGIGAIVLKGAALAKTVYGDIGLRQMRDIDLLVRREDLQCAHDVMSGLGYHSEVRDIAAECYSGNVDYHLPEYTHPQKKTVTIEIHWNITDNSIRLSTDEWWERAVTINIHDRGVLIPSPEDMIVHLCLHSYNHGYNYSMFLKGLCDVAETLRYQEEHLAPGLLMNLINTCGIQRPVFIILFLVKDLFNLQYSPFQQIRPDKAEAKLLTVMEKRLFADDRLISDAPADIVRFLAADTFRKKMKIFLPKSFPSRKFMSARYSVPPSSPKILYYYLLRPFDLLKKYWKYAVALYTRQ